MMKVLVTGATGLIGNEVASELLRRGHDVTALVRDVARAQISLPSSVQVREWRSFEIEPKFEKSDKFDAVIHLAGEPVAGKRWTPEQKKKIYDSRIIGTRTLIRSVGQRMVPTGTWVQGSAIGYYGAGPVEFDESSPGADDFLARVVSDWEAEADKFHGRLVKIRTGIVLSNSSGAFATMKKVFKLGVGGKLGSGLQYMSWIHISDISKLFVFAAESTRADGIINGTAPTPVTNEELTQKLASGLKTKSFLPVPALALKLAMGEMAASVLGSTRVRSRAEGLGFQFKFKTLDEALSDLLQTKIT